MLSEIFVNGCILITIIFITVEFLESDRIKSFFPKQKGIVSGVTFSLSSILLIKYKISINPIVYLDFRGISQASSAYYGGPLSSIITGVISSIVRLFYFKINGASILTFISMIISSIICAFISKTDISRKVKWILMVVTTQLIHSLIFILVIDNPNDIIRVIVYLFIGTLFVATIVYYVFKYLNLNHKQIEFLKQQACVDFLTNVNNRGYFDRIYKEKVKKLEILDQPFSLLMIDIDFFKKVNDQYGHIAGDKVLKDLGYIFNMFTQDQGVVGRIGGEEFAILLESHNNDQAIEFAEDLRKFIEKNSFFIEQTKQIHITVSIGIATYKDTVSDIEEIPFYADNKLYESKKTGRNKTSY